MCFYFIEYFYIIKIQEYNTYMDCTHFALYTTHHALAPLGMFDYYFTLIHIKAINEYCCLTVIYYLYSVYQLKSILNGLYLT